MNRGMRSRILSLIWEGGYRAGTIAELLRVSLSTVARAIAALRGEGVNIVSVRNGADWHYQIREEKKMSAPQTVENKSGKDEFLALKGCIETKGGNWLEEHDEILYGVVKDSAAVYRRKGKKGTKRK